MQSDPIENPDSSAKQPDAATSPLACEELRGWIAAHLAKRTGVDPAAIDSRQGFHQQGLDSLGATAMLHELGVILGRRLSPTLVWEYPTPESLARHLADGDVGLPADARAGTPSLTANEPIAIIGIACRFPGGAHSPAEYWALLRDGVDAVTAAPADRGNLGPWFSQDASASDGKTTFSGAFLDQVDKFDAQFFSISPREATQMDPQQRLMLELSWEALEDASIAPTSLRGAPVSVIVGSIWHDYADLHLGSGSPVVQHRHRTVHEHHCQPHFVCAGIDRSQPGHRHCMFLFSGGRAPCLPELALR